MPVNPMPKATPADQVVLVAKRNRALLAVGLGIVAGALAAGPFAVVGALLAAAAVALAAR